MGGEVPIPGTEGAAEIMSRVTFRLETELLWDFDVIMNEIDFRTSSYTQWAAEETARLGEIERERRADMTKLMACLAKVRVVLTPRSKQFVVGRPMYFKLELINDSHEELIYRGVHYNSNFEILDELNRPVPRSRARGTVFVWEEPFLPRSSLVVFDMFDMARDYKIPRPGRYKVRFNGSGLTIGGNWGRTDRNLMFDGGESAHPTSSNIVEITVLDDLSLESRGSSSECSVQDDVTKQEIEERVKKVRAVLTPRTPEAALGKSVRFRLELVNDGDFDLSFSDELIQSASAFTITDERGKKIESPGGYARGSDRLTPLYAHSSVVLFDTYDLTCFYRFREPGTYYVMFNGYGLKLSGDLGDAQEGYSRDRVCVGGMPSNVVEIRITEEESTEDN